MEKTSTASRRRTTASTKAKNEGAGVAAILNPVGGYRESLARKGVKAKNHHKENLKALRTAQTANETSKAAAAVEAGKEKFKMSRFKNIPAKVTAYMPPPAGSAAAAAAAATPNRAPSAGAGATFLKKNTRPDSATAAAIVANAANANSAAAAADANGTASQRRASGVMTGAKPPVPTRDELKSTAPPTNRSAAAVPNFVRENTREVLRASAAVTAAKNAPPPASYTAKPDYGQTPAYLLQRKLELAADAEKRRLASNADSKDVPPGTVKLSEEERLATLEILNSKLSELLSTLSHLPMFVETPSTVKKKFAIEVDIKEVEDAIKVFSRKTVYVKA